MNDLIKFILKYQKGGDIVNIEDNNGKLFKISRDSEQYLDLYNRKMIQGYDPKTDTYFLSKKGEPIVYNNRESKSNNTIPEVTLKGKKADWVRYKEEYVRNNPKEKFIQDYLDAYPWAGQSLTNYPKRLDEDYENRINDYIGEQIVKNKPQGDLSRSQWLNTLSDKEEEFVKRNPKFETSIWDDTKEGLKSVGIASISSLADKAGLQKPVYDILQNYRVNNSDTYSDREKQEIIKNQKDNPVSSLLGDNLQSLSFLSIPAKMVQSGLRSEYNLTDALKGTKNKAGIVEDILTDPLTYTGEGLLKNIGGNFLRNSEKTADIINDFTKINNSIDMSREAVNLQSPEIFDRIVNFFNKRKINNNFKTTNGFDYLSNVVEEDNVPQGMKAFNKLSYEELAKITKDEYMDLGKTLQMLKDNNKTIDALSNNVLYSPESGFKVRNLQDFDKNSGRLDIIKLLDDVTLGNSRIITERNKLPFLKNKLNESRLSLNYNKNRSLSNYAIEDSNYSRFRHSPVDIINDNNVLFNEAKNYLTKQQEIIGNREIIIGNDAIDDGFKKLTAYTGNENPTLNDKLEIKSRLYDYIGASIDLNGNKYVRDELKQAIKNLNSGNSDDITSSIINDFNFNTNVDNATRVMPKTAYASRYGNKPFMMLSPDYNTIDVLHHEFGHNLQTIFSHDEMTNLDKEIVKELERVNHPENSYILRKYKAEGGQREPAAYFSEVKGDMVDKGFIKNRFEDISEESFSDYLKTKNTPELTKFVGNDFLYKLVNKYYSIPLAGLPSLYMMSNDKDQQKESY